MTVITRTRKLLSLGISARKGNEILGVLLAACVVLLAASLLSFHPQDPSVLHQPPEQTSIRNWIGPVGAQVAALLFALMGVAALLVPALVGVVAWRRLTAPEAAPIRGRGLGVAAVLVSLPGICQLLVQRATWRGVELDAGGVAGVLLCDTLIARLNFGGAFLVLFTVFLIGASLAAQTTLGDLLATLRLRLADAWERLVVARVRRLRRRDDQDARRRVLARGLRSSEVDVVAPAPAGPEAAPARLELELPNRVLPRKGEGRFAIRKVQVSSPAPPAPSPPPRSAGPRSAGPRSPAPQPRQAELEIADELRGPELPPVNLLRTDKPMTAHDEAELIRRGENISTSCSEFGVDGTVVGVSPGPVITVFELQPAPGVKVSRIVGLQDDLALALKAESVRIDRIPGHSTLGIEVPNKQRSLIHLGSLLANEQFRLAPSVLTLALGVDLHGRPYYADLANMPHLLVAGATGAGKSVGLQSMITSILYKATREEVQFIFIDPKRIELGVYADVPHMKTEVVVEPRKAANALRWAVAEMERRYRLLAEVHVRSIAYYNRAIRDPRERQRLALREGESEIQPDDLKPLPYYVIVIDELADLMMVASGDVESSIARLAQMARAVGIHLIVATQRPSVDVLTGTIKANFPCRLAYATATRHDSRTILDQVGSEKLLGRGDALFMPPSTSRILRIHGAYVSEQETAALVRWLKRRGKPELDPDVVKDPEEAGGAGTQGGGEDDPLFDEAARLVVRERQASASYLQRRMRIGFSRAARLVDMLEADGLLGPAQGSKPREVLVPPDYFDEIDAAQDQE
ncbi:MAG TPA: DNA translocase FtsK 4TM domain-containing protein [Thermoanaerobaculia bacterium]